MKKKQKKEVLELSDAQMKAHQERSTAYYLVQNSRKEIDQHVARISKLQKQIQVLDENDSDDDESDDSSVEEEDSQTINEGGVFSSTQNDDAEVTPEKSSAAKKKKKNRSTPRRRRNASQSLPTISDPSTVTSTKSVELVWRQKRRRRKTPPRHVTTQRKNAAPLPRRQPRRRSLTRNQTSPASSEQWSWTKRDVMWRKFAPKLSLLNTIQSTKTSTIIIWRNSTRHLEKETASPEVKN